MRIAFIGHLSVDRNVVAGVERTLHGGGVVHGAITAQRLLPGGVSVHTKCAADDRPRFGDMAEAGVEVRFLPSATSTSIRNLYPTDRPDDRVSTLIARAEPFREADLEGIDAELLHVNPLWLGEFPLALLPAARRRAKILAADAQGLLRRPGEDGRLAPAPLAAPEAVLSLLDVLKVDLGEARTLTGLDEPVPAARRLCELGARLVLLTHGGGVCVHERGAARAWEHAFGPATLEGRTGRGDTCTGAFLTAHFRQGLGIDESARLAAEVTSRKMQYPGPYRG